MRTPATKDPRHDERLARIRESQKRFYRPGCTLPNGRTADEMLIEARQRAWMREVTTRKTVLEEVASGEFGPAFKCGGCGLVVTDDDAGDAFLEELDPRWRLCLVCEDSGVPWPDRVEEVSR